LPKSLDWIQGERRVIHICAVWAGGQMSEECKLGHLTNIPILLTICVSTIWYDQKSHSSGVKYQFALALRRVRVCLLYFTFKSNSTNSVVIS